MKLAAAGCVGTKMLKLAAAGCVGTKMLKLAARGCDETKKKGRATARPFFYLYGVNYFTTFLPPMM